MIAIPLIPGRVYRVYGRLAGCKSGVTVMASHPCEAICIAMGHLTT